MTPKKLLLCLVPVALAVGAVSYYALYFIKTPAFAVKEVVVAVREHDVERFQRHVDVKRVISKSFDDIIVAESTLNKDNIASNPFALGILHLLKPTVVDLLTQEALKEVGKAPSPKEGAPGAKEEKRDPVSDAMKDTVKRKVFYKHLKLKDLSLDKAGEKQATVRLLVHNDLVDKDFTLLLAMERNQDEVWQITEISNLSSVLVEMERARQEQAAAQDKKLLSRMEAYLAVEEARATLQRQAAAVAGKTTLTSGGRTVVVEDEAEVTSLLVSATLHNKGAKALNRLNFDVLLRDGKGQLLYSFPGSYRNLIPPGARAELQLSKRLNPLIPADKALLQEDVAQRQVVIQPSYLSFEDGSSLAPSPVTE